MKDLYLLLTVVFLIGCTNRSKPENNYNTVVLEDSGITIKVSESSIILPTLCNNRDTLEIKNNDTLKYTITDTEFVTYLYFDSDSVRLKSLTPMSSCVISLWGFNSYDEGELTFSQKENEYYVYSGSYNQWHKATIDDLDKVGVVYFPDPYRKDCFWMTAEEFRKYCSAFIQNIK